MIWDRRTILTTSAAGLGMTSLGAIGLCAPNRINETSEPLPRGESFPRMPIGMNLAGIADWETGFPFRNLFLGSRPWITRSLSGKGPFDTKAQEFFQYDSNGYPLEVPVRVPDQLEQQTVFTFFPQPRKSGRHILLYDGDGEVDGLSSVKVIERHPGRLIVQLLKGEENKQVIVIKRSKLGNHVRNIRIVPEQDETIDLTVDPFIPEFLEFCRPFHCLRFMDWGNTNNSLQEQWSERKIKTFYTMRGRDGDPDGTWRKRPSNFTKMFSGSVAYEYMIQLCNQLQIDMWICIPHRANDHYISQLAQMVRNDLDPSLRVYLEYSNELWNWRFVQAQWMLRSPLAGALVEANGGYPWKDSDRTEGKDHPERIGALFRRAFAIWENEWSGQLERLVRVCAVQAGWADASKRTIKWCMTKGGADVVSPAAYIGPDKEIYRRWAAAGATLTAEEVLNDLFSLLQKKRAGGSLREVISFAQENNLPYVAYEGGQHIQPENQGEPPYSPALAAAQTHPRMYDLYVELFRLHRDLDCRMFVHFSSVGQQGTRWGSWGAKANYIASDTTSPKFQALLACNEAR